MQNYSSPSTSFFLQIYRFTYILFFIIFFFTTSTAVAKQRRNMTVPAVFAFGDSIFDAGMNNNIKSMIKCNYPPYGQDFMGGIPTGRFCNGRIPTDLLAEALSTKSYLPAYLDTNLSSEDLLTGVTFASGASGYDPLTSKIASVISLSQQLEYFKECIERMKQLVGVEKTNFIVTNSIYFIVAGNDDIANTYFTTPFRRLNYDIDSYTDLMVASASSFFQDLYKLGARKIGIFGTPPVGCVPAQRTIEGGILRECAETQNQACRLFNSKLIPAINSLSLKLPKAKLVYIDIYTPLTDIVQNPNKYGFEQSVKGCCGTGLIEVTSLLCNKLDAICPDTSKYFFWDSYHPTEKGYKILLDMVIDKIRSSFF